VQPLAYASIFAGALLLIAGLTGSTVPSVAQGRPDRSSSSSTSSPAPAAGGTMPPPTLGNPTSSGAWRSTQAAIAKQHGWSLADWNSVIQRESGGDPTARNASSGAFGIGQFLGSTAREYAPFGALSTNPVLQVKAMAKYIADRYGTPTAALAHERRFGWY
jgi:soluble lytic murein transglycosylase-like protein